MNQVNNRLFAFLQVRVHNQFHALCFSNHARCLVKDSSTSRQTTIWKMENIMYFWLAWNPQAPAHTRGVPRAPRIAALHVHAILYSWCVKIVIFGTLQAVLGSKKLASERASRWKRLWRACKALKEASQYRSLHPSKYISFVFHFNYSNTIDIVLQSNIIITDKKPNIYRNNENYELTLKKDW